MNEFELILKKVKELLELKEHIIIAIDGRCAAGKSTLASELKDKTGCCVIHTDDFFLRPEQRTPQRYQEPGGNVDRERLLEQVLKPLSENQPFFVIAYDCKTQLLSEPVNIIPQKVTIVEGSYSCHPSLWNLYDLRIFLTVGKEEQLRRIEHRNGKEALDSFKEKWIPLEECYFKEYNIEKRCDLRFMPTSNCFADKDS